MLFLLASLRFWDTKKVFFRPVLIMGTALSTGVVVFCYGNIFLHVRRHRQQILNHVSVSMNTRNKKVCINNSINSEERKTLIRQKKIHPHYGLYSVIFLFMLFSCICVPSCGSHCRENWRTQPVSASNLPNCFYTCRGEQFTQPRTLLPSNCRVTGGLDESS